MMYERLSESTRKLRFEHTGLHPQMSLEKKPRLGLGHALDRVADRVIYEAWLGHIVSVWTQDRKALEEVLARKAGPGTVVNLLVGELRYRITNPGLTGPAQGIFGICEACPEDVRVFGQVFEDDKNETRGVMLAFEVSP